jgi:hypothetical protein
MVDTAAKKWAEHIQSCCQEGDTESPYIVIVNDDWLVCYRIVRQDTTETMVRVCRHMPSLGLITREDEPIRWINRLAHSVVRIAATLGYTVWRNEWTCRDINCECRTAHRGTT